MIIQISSGQGPAECELCVTKLFKSLNKEYDDLEVISQHPSKTKGCCTSIMFKTENDLSGLEGTVQWICQSPFRPEHKRKNWFVDVSIIPEVDEICKDQNIRFECFHSGGNGGQNVNKVETGVRLTHIPTGITVTSTAERTQQLNRKDALQKLNAILSEKEAENKAKQTNDAWREHTRIVRGNPVRVYKDMGFNRTE
ncbi:peptide chain release factor [Oribacterium sp. KHPX15]|uniref:peptide chain release factor H n=1 Tax=Oribacterium sp. KHPX15 TaxID=1855342 RepID=UPI000897A4E1|nr:peptide chain release factor H [Oribacterium sp. KHPX15]SEA70730.1 peptide chain release factor [Oribacterium sp. KHPX15]